jgi:hypothetical protein
MIVQAFYQTKQMGPVVAVVGAGWVFGQELDYPPVAVAGIAKAWGVAAGVLHHRPRL